jgi:hypothetical protein
MKEFLQSLVSDNAGGWSTMRLAVLLWCVTLTVVWTIVAIVHGTIPDIPTGVLGVTATFLGAKAIQRIGEITPTTTETTTAPVSPAVPAAPAVVTTTTVTPAA